MIPLNTFPQSFLDSVSRYEFDDRAIRSDERQLAKKRHFREDGDSFHFAGLTSRGRQGLDAAMFLHAFEPLPRWRSPLLRAEAPLYREMRKKNGRYADELARTAHCTLTTAPRRSTCTMKPTNPPSSKHRRGVRAGRGRKRGRGK